MSNPSPVPTTAAPALEVRSLSHRYGDRQALDDVSFAVAPGEILGILGPNGGGKSTLFRLLSTLIAPPADTLTVLGADPARDARTVREGLGVVFQAPSLDGLLTARENLSHQGHLYGLRGSELSGRIDELLAALGLADRAGERVSRFSGGMRRRLEIAKALLHDPRLLLLDEPSTGLDPAVRRDVWTLLENLREQRELTVVLTTHLMDEAERCDRVGVLDRGKLVALDTPDALRSRVGGDVVTIAADEPGPLAADIRTRFGFDAQVTGPTIRFEHPNGPEVVASVAGAFPGRLRTIAMGRPTLEDVFLQVTGRQFAEADAEGRPAPERKRRR